MKDKITRILSIILTCFLIIMIMIFPTSAASGILRESEYNGSYASADVTYDDYTNYGSISSSSDEDWWTIHFYDEGIANFWLGDIPENCDYDLQVYDYTGNKLLVESLKGSNSQELTKIHVRPGEDYYIRIFSHSGYSSTAYTFRIKRYNLQKSRMFTQNITNNTYPTQAATLPFLSQMGFSTQCFLNSDAATAYQLIPLSDIMIIRSHGGPGCVQIDKTSTNYSLIYGKSFSSMPSTGRALSNYYFDELSNSKLILFTACQTGKSNSVYGNLVDIAIERGAFCCFGWNETIYTAEGNLWVPKFFEFCAKGHNIGNARKLTNEWADEMGLDDSIRNQYVGASRNFATLLG